MKSKFIVSVILGLLFSFSLSLAGPLVTSGSAFEGKLETWRTNKDTLAGVDSQTLFTKWTPSEKGWNYYLSYSTITGGGSDSVLFDIWVDSYVNDSVLVCRNFVDSTKTAYSKSILLPIYDGIPGTKFTIKVISRTGNGGVVITNGWQLNKFRLIE
jgi:hypothetical protein